jgi:tetratricopeptide (TPR) repeat protein
MMLRRAVVVAATLLAIASRGIAQSGGTVAPQRPTAPGGQASGRILVMPFDNVNRDPRIVWLGEAASVLLADDLIALGANAITRDERQKAFELLQVAEAPSLTDATMIRIGQVVGAAQVVVGTIRLDGDDLLVQARAIALESARVQGRVTHRGPITELFAVFEHVAQQLTPAGVRTAAAPARHPPVGAFENYIKGLLAETPDTAIGYLTSALQADPSFDRARLALWTIYDDQGEHAKALESMAAVAETSPLVRQARFRAGISQIHLQRYADAFATFKALLDARPTAAVYNNLGVVQMKRANAAASGRPTYYFNKAADSDPAASDYCFNLGYAYWAERDLSAATYWLRDAVRRDPTDGDAHYLLGAVLAASGNPTEAGREKELARRLASTYAEWDKRPVGDPIPKGLERLAADVELPRAGRTLENLTSNDQRDQRELAAFYLDRGRRLFQQERDGEAITELRRVVFLQPYEAEAHLLIGRIHLRSGRFRDAIDAFKISLWSADTADAHAALAEAYLAAREDDNARTEAERALALEPSSSVARRVLATLAAK